jgi:hypothetical protein
MALQKGVNGGGGRFGSGHSSKNDKPKYMSHIPDGNMSADTPQTNAKDSMSHGNLMGKCGGAVMAGLSGE